MRDSGLHLARRDLATEVRILPGLLRHLSDQRAYFCVSSSALSPESPRGAYPPTVLNALLNSLYPSMAAGIFPVLANLYRAATKTPLAAEEKTRTTMMQI